MEEADWKLLDTVSSLSSHEYEAQAQAFDSLDAKANWVIGYTSISSAVAAWLTSNYHGPWFTTWLIAFSLVCFAGAVICALAAMWPKPIKGPPSATQTMTHMGEMAPQELALQIAVANDHAIETIKVVCSSKSSRLRASYAAVVAGYVFLLSAILSLVLFPGKQEQKDPTPPARTRPSAEKELDRPRDFWYTVSTMKIEAPQTLLEAVKYFADPDVCREFVAGLRWPDGVTCPHCGAKDPYFLETVKLWKCRDRECRKKFSVKVGTIFEDSPLGLDKWLPAIWLIVNAKNGISSWEIHRSVGVTQKTAWFMLQRIRLAMQSGSLDKLNGEVEADETLIGGKARFMHADRKAKTKGRTNAGKVIVMGLLERNGRVRTKVVPNAKRETLCPEIRENVEPGTALYTDALASYGGLDPEYVHQVINHAECYAKGRIHTNGLENYWSLFKRCIKGTYIAVEPFHLFRYLDEEEFRFNSRMVKDADRFRAAVANVAGRRLTYKHLIAEDGKEA